VFDEPAPLCSVNTGAAGAAYALYRIASTRQDAEALALAELWISRAERHADNWAAFYSRELDLSPQTVGRASLFHSPAGVACVHALICTALGDDAGAAHGVERFITRSQVPCDQIDLTLGRASILLGAVALLAALPKDAAAPRAALRELGDHQAGEIRAMLAGMPPVGDGSTLNLGIAHGWGGMLFALLRWREIAGRRGPDPLIATRLGELEARGDPVGNGLRWPWLGESPGANSYMPGWCNGSAGLVHLWSLAERILGESRYGDLARRAAVNAWEEPRNVGDLCCGTAGRAYAMLDLYRHTGDGVWCDRARALADDAARSIGSWSLRRDSLYKGEIGVAVLLADLEWPELSCMPLFDREL
jgi:serine/threonine-protein kinase